MRTRNSVRVAAVSAIVVMTGIATLSGFSPLLKAAWATASEKRAIGRKLMRLERTATDISDARSTSLTLGLTMR